MEAFPEGVLDSYPWLCALNHHRESTEHLWVRRDLILFNSDAICWQKTVILFNGLLQSLQGTEQKRPGKTTKSPDLKEHKGEMIHTLLIKCWCNPHKFWKWSLTPLYHIFFAWNTIAFFNNLVSLISLYLLLPGASQNPYFGHLYSLCLLNGPLCLLLT